MNALLHRLSLLSLVLISACSSQPGSADAESLDVTLAGDDGVLTFEIWSDGPLVEGNNDLHVDVRHQGAPFTGSAIQATVRMASMTHSGSSPDASELADGEFVLHDVALDMPGEWRLEVYAENDGQMKIRDTVVVTLEVP